MADSAASPQSRPHRAASNKCRQATVSTETENKLARAARSAQRLAQLSDAARDDSTLDLFPDDPTRATLEAMKIDVRQGTLHGFELPDVVLAAVGAVDPNESASLEAKTRRAHRATKIDELVPVNGLLSGLEIEPVGVEHTLAFVDERPDGDSGSAAEVADADKSSVAAALPLALAAATVARSITALRQSTELGTTCSDGSSNAATSSIGSATGGNDKARQRFAATFAKAAMASQEAGLASRAAASALPESGLDGTARVGTASEGMASEGTASKGTAPEAVASSRVGLAGVANGAASDGAKTRSAVPASPELAAMSAEATTAPKAAVHASRSPSAQSHFAFAGPWREAQRAEAAAAALRAAPELDRARATAFADTVDALYGVIADQRRAATDHSRRMKWMLSIVVGALLVTVAIGITQTLLLMRLTRKTAAQQHHFEQMMQTQQAAMVSLFDNHPTMANAAAANAASGALAVLPAAQQAAVASNQPRNKRGTRTHTHKPKADTTH